MSKSDKYAGIDAPVVRRRTNPVPERPTPKAATRAVDRPFGYSWIWGYLNKERKRSYAWFKTEKARDQSFGSILTKKAAFEKAIGAPNSYSMRDIKKEMP